MLTMCMQRQKKVFELIMPFPIGPDCRRLLKMNVKIFI